MIRFPTYPEPADFEARVRSRGNAFLATTPRPTNAQWRTKEFWMSSHDQLYNLYGGICMYCASWTARRESSRLQGNTSIDHFLPKSICPELAYEWTNFRLCRSQLNQRKNSSLDVIDPFAINSDWFQLDFFTFRIQANPMASRIVRDRVESTINRLGLNDAGYVKERVAVMKQYCFHGIPFSKIQGKYPFIAREIKRAEFDALIKPAFMRAFNRR